MRSSPLLLLVTAVALTGAPFAHAAGPAVCNGKHKRAANPYGSILATGLTPVVAATTPAPTPAPTTAAATAPAGARPTAISRAERRASFAPCGDAA